MNKNNIQRVNKILDCYQLSLKETKDNISRDNSESKNTYLELFY